MKSEPKRPPGRPLRAGLPALMRQATERKKNTMEERTITVTITEKEAGNIIRSLKSRAAHWNLKSTEAETHESFQCYRNIAKHYDNLAKKIDDLL